LDSVLIGLRTRDLLLRLLHERSQTMRVAVLLEDLHWIDRASEELLTRVITEATLPLLIVNTFRPEYQPPWAGQHGIFRLGLEPLLAADIAQIAEARLSSCEGSQPVARVIADKAEGNPLFAEEIANFIVDQAALNLEARSTSLPNTMPASLQLLLTARVHRLAPADSALLQAASVIGRRFSADLLAAVTHSAVDLGPRLSAMLATDLIRAGTRSGEFVFKHALVRDALYESLLVTARADLHLKIAMEIERRVAARPIEAAETLAHHYVKTSRIDKAVGKSLGIYSLNEAEKFLRQALTLSRSQHPGDLDEHSLDIIADLTKVLTQSFKTHDIVVLVEPEIAAIEKCDDHPQASIILYFYGFALFFMCRFAEGRRIQDRALEIAYRHDNSRAKAYAAAGLMFSSTATEPLSPKDFQRIAQIARGEAQRANDVHVFGSAAMSIAWNHLCRGLVRDAAEWAERLLQYGRERRDPRLTAIGLWLLAWHDLLIEDYASALIHSEECIAVASTQMDRMMACLTIAIAQIMSGEVARGEELIRRVRHEADENHCLYLRTGCDGPLGVAMVLSGHFKQGLSWLEAFVSEYGNVAGADLGRLMLAEIYVALLVERRPPLRVLVRNLPAFIKARIKASREAERLLKIALQSPQFSERGVFRARIEFNLGLLHKARNQSPLAREHFERARLAASEQKAVIILAKIDAALASA
jgi:tetratricopeptide (TPR) repeat protein